MRKQQGHGCGFWPKNRRKKGGDGGRGGGAAAVSTSVLWGAPAGEVRNEKRAPEVEVRHVYDSLADARSATAKRSRPESDSSSKLPGTPKRFCRAVWAGNRGSCRPVRSRVWRGQQLRCFCTAVSRKARGRRRRRRSLVLTKAPPQVSRAHERTEEQPPPSLSRSDEGAGKDTPPPVSRSDEGAPAGLSCSRKNDEEVAAADPSFRCWRGRETVVSF